MDIVGISVKKQKKLYIVLYFVILIKGILGVALALILKKLIDSFSYTSKPEIISNIIFIFIYVIVFISVQIIYNYLASLITKKCLLDIKNNTVKNILKLSLTELYQKNSSSYISLMTNHIEDLEKDYLSSVISLSDMATNLVFSGLMLFYLNPIIGGVALLATVFSLLIPITISNHGNTLKTRYSIAQEDLTTLTKDILNGVQLIKSYHVETNLGQDYERKNKIVEKCRFKYNFTIGIINGISMFLGYIVFFSVIIVGLFLSLNSIITVGTLIACVNLSNALVNPIMNGIQYIFKIKSMKGIKEKFNIESLDVADGKQKVEKLCNRIEFQNVNFEYNKQFGVKNINLIIEKGKKYVIVGNSGSGKTTLLNLLMGQHRNYTGKILIDGIELKEIVTGNLSTLYSLVNQSPFLFDGTIEDNIRFFQHIDSITLKDSIHKAGLEKFIEERENRIDDLVGEDGNHISGGEKQRIAIARALSRNSDIILLDEATSNLDNITSMSIEKILLCLDSTVVSITHKLTKDIICQYDEIIALNNGTIVEKGNFNSLIEKKGLFYSLFFLDNL